MKDFEREWEARVPHFAYDVNAKPPFCWPAYRSQFPIFQDPIFGNYYDALFRLSCGPTKLHSPGTLRMGVLYAIRALWLDRRDPWHVSDHLPYSLISLRHEHLAYDVIKWYAVTLLPGCQQYFLGTPLFNIANADRSEDPLPLLGDEERACPLSFHYLMPLLLLKARLVEHLVNVERFYHFIAVVNKLHDLSFSTPGKTTKAGAILGKLAGNAHVLHHIKSFMLDPQHLPTSKFIVHDMNSLLKQMIQLIQLMTRLNSKIWMAIYLPERMHGEDWEDRDHTIGKREYRNWSFDELGLMSRLFKYFCAYTYYSNEGETILWMVVSLYEKAGRGMKQMTMKQLVSLAKQIAKVPVGQKEDFCCGVGLDSEGRRISLLEIL
jgi:hypothetical protein